MRIGDHAEVIISPCLDGSRGGGDDHVIEGLHFGVMGNQAQRISTDG